MAVTKQDLYDYILKSKYNFNGNIFGPMLDEYVAENGTGVELPEGYEDTIPCKGENTSQFFAGQTYLYWDEEEGKLKIGEGTYSETPDSQES